MYKPSIYLPYRKNNNFDLITREEVLKQAKHHPPLQNGVSATCVENFFSLPLGESVFNKTGS